MKNFILTILAVFCWTSAMAYDKLPYIVLPKDGKTLTVYYDSEKESRDGEIVIMERWRIDSDDSEALPFFTFTDCPDKVEKVISDSFFADARSTSTHSWLDGMEKLVIIEGIENLNISQVTDMRRYVLMMP